ncbi:MAG: glycosyltransferase [Pyrinomonadaceae bacterium]|nr:glycosyltransferase [Pyrinomonadaceae bacterium]
MSLMMETADRTETPARIARHAAVPPAVSVIIPAYNVAPYISEALDSVLAQTFKSLEIIVINDGSPDTPDLERALEPYREHLVYLKQENRGAAAARNTGLYVARGEFVAFLDADDWWLPDFLRSQVEFINHSQCDFAYADALIFGESPLSGKTYMQTAPSKGEVTFESLITARCNVITSGVVARRQVILDVGLFDEELLRAHDFDLWLRMIRHGARAGYQKKVLLNYRVRPDSLSGNAIEQVERELEAYDKIERHLELTPDEREMMAAEVKRLEADLRVERGKLHLTREEFDSAATEFRAARKYHRHWKLPAVMLMLRFAPRLLLRIYRTRR